MGTIAQAVLLGVAVAMLAVVRVERDRVPQYVTVGRLLFFSLGVLLVRTDAGVAVLVLFAALLCRVRDRSYADRFRRRASELAQFDPELYDELGPSVRS